MVGSARHPSFPRTLPPSARPARFRSAKQHSRAPRPCHSGSHSCEVYNWCKPRAKKIRLTRPFANQSCGRGGCGAREQNHGNGGRTSLGLIDQSDTHTGHWCLAIGHSPSPPQTADPRSACPPATQSDSDRPRSHQRPVRSRCFRIQGSRASGSSGRRAKRSGGYFSSSASRSPMSLAFCLPEPTRIIRTFPCWSITTTCGMPETP